MFGIWVAVNPTTSKAGLSRKQRLKLWKSRPAAPMITTRRAPIWPLPGKKQRSNRKFRPLLRIPYDEGRSREPRHYNRGVSFVKVRRTPTGRRVRPFYEVAPKARAAPAEPSASDTGTACPPGGKTGGVSVRIGVRPSPALHRPVRASFRIRMARNGMEGTSRFRNTPQRAEASGGTV